MPTADYRDEPVRRPGQRWPRVRPQRVADNTSDDTTLPDLPTQSGSDLKVDVYGERRRNLNLQSTTNPEARLAKKGNETEATLTFLGHVWTENRNGLVVDLRLIPGTGTAEQEAALDMLRH
jgi:hypothetical protein